MIIFLSDNGIELPWTKRSLYDLGVRTPLILAWKGHIWPGQVNQQAVVSTVDLVPTILDILGIEPKVQTDGISFLCLLESRPDNWKREYAFCCFNFLNLSKANAKISAFNDHLYENDPEFRPSRALHNNKYSYVFHCWDSHTPNTIEITHGGFLTQLLKQGDQKDPLHIPFIRIEIIFVHVDMILFELQDAFKKISEKYKLERIQSNIHENIGNYI